MHNRNSSSCHGSMTARMPLLKELCRRDEMEIESQIHKMEKEAYSSVLRAFIAQSDLLSWSKEGLMTELRKELNVTDLDHGQLLVEIKSDESIKKIKEWQKGAHESLSSIPYIATTPSVAPREYDAQIAAKAKLKYVAQLDKHKEILDFSIHTLSKRVNWAQDRRTVSGNSAKYIKIDHNIQGLPQLKQGYQAPDSGNFKNCVKYVDHNIQEPPNSREGPVQSLMKQGYQEPDSGNFRGHMKIVDHNSQEPPNSREGPVQSQMKQGSQAPDYGNFRGRIKIADHYTQGPVSNRAVPPQYQLKNKTQAPDAGDFKHCSEVIEIWVTDEIIHQVETMTSGPSNSDPVQLEKAKLILSEHESAIFEALSKLEDVPDHDDSVDPQHYSYEAIHGNGSRMLADHESLREAGRWHGYSRERFLQTHPVSIDE